MIDSSRYTDAAFLDLERERIFRRSWLAVCPEYRLRRPGDFVTFDEVGVSIVLTRDASGEIHAFHNACRHRGTRLLEGRGCVETIQCPYHGWRYGLGGALEEVPGSEGFGNIDHAKRGLAPVRMERRAGFVWICLAEDAPPLDEHLAGVDEILAPYRVEEYRPIFDFATTIPCNWKAFYDNVFDSYHLDAVHGRSVAPVIHEARQEIVEYGDHAAMIVDVAWFKWRDWIDRHTSRGGPYTERQRRSLHRAFIFPNLLINLLPSSATVYSVWPVDTDTCRLRYAFLKRDGARGLEWLRVHGTALASRWILREDLPIMRAFQNGVRTGPVSHPLFHAEEAAVARFHAIVNRWVRD